MSVPPAVVSLLAKLPAGLRGDAEKFAAEWADEEHYQAVNGDWDGWAQLFEDAVLYARFCNDITAEHRRSPQN